MNFLVVAIALLFPLRLVAQTPVRPVYKTNELQLLSATAGIGQYAKCSVQQGRSVTNLLLQGLSTEVIHAWGEVKSREMAVQKLEAQIAGESARIRKIQDSGVEIEYGSRVHKEIDALSRKETDLEVLNKQLTSARSNYRKLARVRAVFTGQVYGGMQVWRVAE